MFVFFDFVGGIVRKSWFLERGLRRQRTVETNKLEIRNEGRRLIYISFSSKAPSDAVSRVA